MLISNDVFAEGEKVKGISSSDVSGGGHEGRKDKAAEDNKKDKVKALGDEDKKSPVYVKANTFHLNSKSNVFTYKGNVQITRGDLLITSDVAVGRYDKSNRIDRIVCEENVVITRGDSLRASSDRAVYQVPVATIELTQGPELFHNGNALTADKVTIYVDEDRSEAEGNVRVKVVKTENNGEDENVFKKALEEKAEES